MSLLSVARKVRMPLLLKQSLAEMLGSFVLVLVGTGAVAQKHVLASTKGDDMPGLLGVSVAFGVGLALAVALVGNISGGHINPVVSVMMALLRDFPLINLAPYMLAQLAGAFLAAATVYLVYMSAFDAFPMPMGVLATYPQNYLSLVCAIFDQLVGSTLLVLVVLAITDPKRRLALEAKAAFVGLTLLAVGLFCGVNAGFAINPARDLGPRIFSAFVHGFDVFTEGDPIPFFIIPLVVPFLGAFLAAVIYAFLLVDNGEGVDEDQDYNEDQDAENGLNIRPYEQDYTYQPAEHRTK